jgi:hypothetical protein
VLRAAFDVKLAQQRSPFAVRRTPNEPPQQ